MKQIFKKIIAALLKAEARIVLKKYRPKIVAITGSVGKTSTKDAIFSVLSTKYFVRKSSKSFNSEIGVPLTVLGLQNAWNSPGAWLKNLLDGLALIVLPNKYPKWLVVEVGADRPGDIRSIASWLRPDIAVVTKLSEVPVHVEFFDSAEQVRQEKAQLVRPVSKDGTVILNVDDKLVSSFRPLTKAKVITFGANNLADVHGSHFKFVYDRTEPYFPVGISFQVEIKDKPFEVEIDGVLGHQQMYIFLAALAVAKTLNVDPEKAIRALQSGDFPPGRMKILSGINDTCIIDDTYNSSPVAAAEALETLRNLKCTGKKILVLGCMLELGKHSLVEHRKLGKRAAGIADEIYTVGTRGRGIYDAAISAGLPKDRVHKFDDSVAAGEMLRKNIKAGDIVLVKGSQGKRMEKAVAMIMAEPERAPELLVRQEKEWQDR